MFIIVYVSTERNECNESAVLHGFTMWKARKIFYPLVGGIWQQFLME